MKLSILQMNIQLGNFSANLETLQRQLALAMETRPDVVLLPELWDIGFYPRPIEKYADPDGGRIRKILGDLAAQYQINIVGGSIANRIGQHVFNTSYVFDRTGHLVSTYHKTHLFSPLGEAHDFTAGDTISTYTIDGVKCATLVCYDIRFPELVRRLALEKISLLFVPAAWPIERLMHWQTLTRARAIENQIFVAAANGSGSFEDGIQLGGHSRIIDPWGEILAEAGEEENTLHANLRLVILNQIRESMSIFSDRRPELYE